MSGVTQDFDRAVMLGRAGVAAMTSLRYAVLIPTIGRPGPAQLVATADGIPAPSCIVVADDRRDATSALDLPATSAPLVLVRTHGRDQRLRGTPAS